ncbi:hypothetical protein CRG98_040861 [Punica granatum]|uniref:Uncharacterized protein n=1 Tax=Punica granatum TaxID=22663 RepID=A0A2I0I457_PUNGR|nr:hypothetical protein CRG98_040861 [Punica granatum]
MSPVNNSVTVYDVKNEGRGEGALTRLGAPPQASTPRVRWLFRRRGRGSAGKPPAGVGPPSPLPSFKTKNGGRGEGVETPLGAPRRPSTPQTSGPPRLGGCGPTGSPQPGRAPAHSSLASFPPSSVFSKRVTSCYILKI